MPRFTHIICPGQSLLYGGTMALVLKSKLVPRDHRDLPSLFPEQTSSRGRSSSSRGGAPLNGWHCTPRGPIYINQAADGFRYTCWCSFQIPSSTRQAVLQQGSAHFVASLGRAQTHRKRSGEKRLSYSESQCSMSSSDSRSCT